MLSPIVMWSAWQYTLVCLPRLSLRLFVTIAKTNSSWVSKMKSTKRKSLSTGVLTELQIQLECKTWLLEISFTFSKEIEYQLIAFWLKKWILQLTRPCIIKIKQQFQRIFPFSILSKNKNSKLSLHSKRNKLGWLKIRFNQIMKRMTTTIIKMAKTHTEKCQLQIKSISRTTTKQSKRHKMMAPLQSPWMNRSNTTKTLTVLTIKILTAVTTTNNMLITTSSNRRIKMTSTIWRAARLTSIMLSSKQKLTDL